MAKISVIIPVYNREDYLRQALDSVVNQTLKDIEIICVDDCSTDSSLNILKEYAQKDDRIIVLEQEQNQGQGVARNRALDIAKGEYIMFLDPDDWYELNACELCYNQISKNKNDFVIFPHIKHWEGSENAKLEIFRIQPYASVISKPQINPYELGHDFYGNSITACNIYSKKFIDKFNIRYSNLRNNEDVIFAVRTILETTNISIIEQFIYHYRVHQTNTSLDFSNYHDIIKSRRDTYQIVKESENGKQFMPYFLNYAIKTSVTYFLYYSKNNKAIRKGFYNEIKDFFTILNEEQVINSDVIPVKRYYKYFKRITNWNYGVWVFYYTIREVLHKNKH